MLQPHSVNLIQNNNSACTEENFNYLVRTPSPRRIHELLISKRETRSASASKVESNTLNIKNDIISTQPPHYSAPRRIHELLCSQRANRDDAAQLTSGKAKRELFIRRSPLGRTQRRKIGQATLRIETYLKQRELFKDMLPRGLSEITANELICIADHLLSCIGCIYLNQRQSKTHNCDYVLHSLKQLKYEHKVEKAWLMTPSAPHCHEHVVLLLDFLIDKAITKKAKSNHEEATKSSGLMNKNCAVSDREKIEMLLAEEEILERELAKCRQQIKERILKITESMPTN